MTAAASTQALMRLMAWLSPAFPVGGFAYSSGLERAVHDRLVTDAAGLEAWLSTSLRHGMLWNDAVFVSLAARCYEASDPLSELAELALALAGSAERHMETLSLGKAFLMAATAWPSPVFERLPVECPYPVSVGAVAGAHGISAEQAIAAFLHAGLSQGVSAGIRLGVAGQQDGLRILSALEATAGKVAERAVVAELNDLGSATVQADIASIRHEAQVSRLFRS
ncbi:urease accessory protein UreF [Rhizobium lemnae]|uniref:Urease accessory protein UreF n=1 Tax=Rhizobium lemnae TaxID=1214924 RepID=A0ABV8EDV2_9HYPH|nr:urease accessory protein UreF [Rhizobium lemnae]MCJ8509905.1 urease accessory protein UreF [Rhizobium lemnae]